MINEQVVVVNPDGTNIMSAQDIQIGSVELKDSDSAALANIKAANTARTTATVVVATQPIDAAGAVLRTSAIETAVQLIDNAVSGTGFNISQVNGETIDVGAGTEAAAIRVTLPTDGTGKVTAVSGTAANLKSEAVGTKTHNAAVPSTNISVLPGVANAAAPTYTETYDVKESMDLSGNQRVTQGTLIAGEDQTNDVLKVENRYSYAYCVADTAVKASAGFVHSLTFSPLDAAATAGTIFLYDQTSEAVPTVFSYYIPAAALVPVTVILDVVCTTGIYIGFTTVADVACTVAYR